jgi:anhydro-N-acetylmuramic acid kinase
MNPNISKLHNIAGKKSRLIIGLMSGTSLDGLDIALCRFTGSGPQTQIDIVAFDTIGYDDHFKKEVRSVFSNGRLTWRRSACSTPGSRNNMQE